MLSLTQIRKVGWAMIKIGQFNKLKMVREAPFGVYLQGGKWGDILLPNKSVPKSTLVGDVLDVFVYFDSDDKIIATTVRPHAQLGDFAFLKVIDVNTIGAFLDWGLDKDLLVPGTEQHRPMEKGKSYLVYLKQDKQGRIIASSKIDYFLDKTAAHFKSGEEVSLLIAESTPLGRKVVINNSHWGLIHADDIFQTLMYGKKMKGYIKKVREDGKVDVVLRRIGQNSINELAQRIVSKLEQSGGFLALHDKSAPSEIQKMFSESKKNFKSALGQLYKRGLIDIEEKGVRLKSMEKR